MSYTDLTTLVEDIIDTWGPQAPEAAIAEIRAVCKRLENGEPIGKIYQDVYPRMLREIGQ